MRILIVEDDFASRKMLQKYLSPYGECDVVVDGQEALDAFTFALKEEKPYDLVCLDIMLPKIDGQDVLKNIRKIEGERGIEGLEGVKVIMTTALGDTKNIMDAFKNQCEGYLQKPIERVRLIQEIRKLKLIV
ncbi:MAG: response regulator transcription factor [Spirochaetales bacterium]|nr:response regulator transcription factor [Spirochaetales bacterium]